MQLIKNIFELNATTGLQANGSATIGLSTSNTTFGVGTDNKLNGNGDAMVAYVFAPQRVVFRKITWKQ